MPEIRRFSLPEGTTVSQQLHDAAVDLLPAEMAKNSLVRWVTEHDGLIREIRERIRSSGHLTRSGTGRTQQR